MAALNTENDEKVQEFVLESDSELRFELESKNAKVKMELKSGMAEMFGTEIVKGKTYTFQTGAKIAIFTWQGCTLELRGNTDVSYIAKETPMTMYLNCHAALEQLRKYSENTGKRGPIAMIVGPCDVGKTTVSRILLNYAVRMGRRPIRVDLDVGQGQISIPGTIGAMLIERPASVEGAFSQQAPLVYHFGHTTPNANIELYNLLVTKMAEVVSERMEANKKANISGAIIDTCGWVRNEGYKLLLHMARAFEVDVILVIDQERLYNELQRDLPNFVRVVFLPKSRGVVERSQANRRENRDKRVNNYFYGSSSQLFPHSFDVKLSDVQLYKIGAPTLPDSCMPLGMSKEENKTKLVQVTPGTQMLNHIFAVSFAGSAEDDVIQTNVAGFICVTNIDMDRGVMTVLSPQPRPLPQTILLLSELQFIDSH